MKAENKFGLIGVGNMGEAILRGILNQVLFAPEQIVITDIIQPKVIQLKEELGVRAVSSIGELLAEVDVCLYAAKPQNVPQVLPEIAKAIHPPQWFISIAAGVKTSILEGYLPEGIPVVRVMPSITVSVGEGAAAICGGHNATWEHLDFTQQIFEAVGKATVMDEKLLDVVTGLSGSGPAYVFLFIEAFIDAGVELGLTRPDAELLALQTVLGASKMVVETGEHPAILRNKVTSPGGTTAAGLYQLERGKLRAVLADAVRAATQRSMELAKA